MVQLPFFFDFEFIGDSFAIDHLGVLVDENVLLRLLEAVQRTIAGVVQQFGRERKAVELIRCGQLPLQLDFLLELLNIAGLIDL